METINPKERILSLINTWDHSPDIDYATKPTKVNIVGHIVDIHLDYKNIPFAMWIQEENLQNHVIHMNHEEGQLIAKNEYRIGDRVEMGFYLTPHDIINQPSLDMKCILHHKYGNLFDLTVQNLNEEEALGPIIADKNPVLYTDVLPPHKGPYWKDVPTLHYALVMGARNHSFSTVGEFADAYFSGRLMADNTTRNINYHPLDYPDGAEVLKAWRAGGYQNMLPGNHGDSFPLRPLTLHGSIVSIQKIIDQGDGDIGGSSHVLQFLSDPVSLLGKDKKVYYLRISNFSDEQYEAIKQADLGQDSRIDLTVQEPLDVTNFQLPNMNIIRGSVESIISIRKFDNLGDNPKIIMLDNLKKNTHSEVTGMSP